MKPDQAVAAIREACVRQRNRLVQGTPEKYPGTIVAVKLLDAEALLAELNRARADADAAMAVTSKWLTKNGVLRAELAAAQKKLMFCPDRDGGDLRELEAAERDLAAAQEERDAWRIEAGSIHHRELVELLAVATAEVGRYRRSMVAHHNIANLSAEAISESIGGPCQICAKAQRDENIYDEDDPEEWARDDAQEPRWGS